jgi:nucleotide-binding universal stress UspA family protein
MPTAVVERVLVGISGSLGNLAALHAAAGQARRFDAPLIPIAAWTPPGGETGNRRAPCKLILDLCEEQAGKSITDALTDAFGGTPPDVAVTSVIIRGAAGPSLVHLASKPGDLLVVGGGRSGTVSRLWHGSASRYCVRHARCPVLVVRPPEMITELRHLRGLEPSHI